MTPVPTARSAALAVLAIFGGTIAPPALATAPSARPQRATATATATVATSTRSAEFSAGAGPELRELVEDALERRPELAQMEALIRAERERVERATALPDPSLSLGIQNDGFTSIEIGTMETSFLSIMASQTFPWPGKRDLRGELARFGVEAAELQRTRARLTTAADVQRAFVALLLARGQLGLLEELSALWTQSEQTAKARYEAGEAAQSDLLRAQLERARLDKRRWALLAEERTTLRALNRLRARAPETPIATRAMLEGLPDPQPIDLARALDEALAFSPEVQAAQLAVSRAARDTALAEKDLFPDITVSVGVMPRGALPPMWQANVSVTLPVFAASKQDRAIAERRALGEAEVHAARELELILRERVESRTIALRALLDTAWLYRKGLLVQARATAESTLAQYRVGRVTFASVLEAVAGYVADRNELLTTLAAAQRVAIAGAELSLTPTDVGGGGALSAGGMPGAGSMGGAGGGSAKPTSAAPEQSGGSAGGM